MLVSLVLMAFVGLACLAGVGGLILMLSTRGSRGRNPACGHCGYDLTGSTANRCPECGQLFIEAGIKTGRGNPPRRWVGWTLVAIAGLVVPFILLAGFYAVAQRQSAARAAQAQALRATLVAQQAYAQQTSTGNRPAAGVTTQSRAAQQPADSTQAP